MYANNLTRHDRSHALAAVLLLAGASMLDAQQSERRRPEPPTPSDNQESRVTVVNNFGVLDPIADRVRARGQFLESWANARLTYMKSLIEQEKVYQERIQTRIKKWEMHDWKVDRDWDNLQKGKDRILDNKKRDRDRFEQAVTEVPPDKVGIAGGQVLNIMFEQIKREHWSGMAANSTAQELSEAVLDDLRLVWGSGNAKARLKLNEGGVDLTYKLPFEKINDDFDAIVKLYEKEREIALRAAKDTERADGIRNSLELLEQMEIALKSWYGKHKATINTDSKYLARRAWSNFIDEQLKQMRNQINSHALPPAFTGKTIQLLLDYMKTNGLEFAKADKGGESSYLALHNMMRDIINEVKKKQ